MFFYIPTKIYCEANCIAKHAEELTRLGTRAMIVTGRSSSKKNGSLKDVTDVLKTAGIPYLVFDRVEENPSVETVMEARATGIEFQADFIIGIGGGSPLDAAKAIALMIRQKDQAADWLYTPGSDEALPVAAIPTTCGTGSEATPWSILTRHDQKIKGSISHKVFPALALCDAGYLQAAPLSVLAATAVDACGHCIESYLNTKATAFSRMLSLQGLTLWAGCKDILNGSREASPENLQSLLTASTLAGMAISHTSTSIPHGLSYYLTYDENIPHGLAVGRFLPGYLKAAESVLPGEVSLLLRTMGFSRPEEFADFLSAIQTVTILPSTKSRAVQGILSNPAKLASCPFSVTEELLTTCFLQ